MIWRAWMLRGLVESSGEWDRGPYLVVRTRLHGGGVVSRHRTLRTAWGALRRYQSDDCSCGCAAVVPTAEYGALPTTEQAASPYAICRPA